MASDETRRREILMDLIGLRTDPEVAITAVGQLAWGYPSELGVLTRADVRHVLDLIEAGELSTSAAQRWADTLEVREDVAYEAGFEGAIARVLFDLASPEINGPPTPERLKHWKGSLAAEATTGPTAS